MFIDGLKCIIYIIEKLKNFKNKLYWLWLIISLTIDIYIRLKSNTIHVPLPGSLIP